MSGPVPKSRKTSAVFGLGSALSFGRSLDSFSCAFFILAGKSKGNKSWRGVWIPPPWAFSGGIFNKG